MGDESRLEESLKECLEEGDANASSNSSEVFLDHQASQQQNLNTILANENLLGTNTYLWNKLKKFTGIW